MKLPYWLQPGSQQFIDYLALVNEMDYPGGIIRYDRAVYPNRTMAHYNALRRFCVDTSEMLKKERCIVSQLEVMRLYKKAMERERIDADLF